MSILIDQITNSPLQTDIIYFDISKAFDTVFHSILLTRLWSVDISGVLWASFRDYLANHFQTITVTSYDSLPGVPQGSVLGLLLF